VDAITSAITVLTVLSISVERVVEIIKNMIPSLALAQSDTTKENRRKAYLHFIGVVAGTAVAWVAWDQFFAISPVIFKSSTPEVLKCAIIGFLASGGSSFWNQSLAIVEEVKKVRKLNTLKMAKEQAPSTPQGNAG
jgi:hypothetical protein